MSEKSETEAATETTAELLARMGIRMGDVAEVSEQKAIAMIRCQWSAEGSALFHQGKVVGLFRDAVMAEFVMRAAREKVVRELLHSRSNIGRYGNYEGHEDCPRIVSGHCDCGWML